MIIFPSCCLSFTQIIFRPYYNLPYWYDILRYDYRFDPFTQTWLSLQRLRDQGILGTILRLDHFLSIFVSFSLPSYLSSFLYLFICQFIQLSNCSLNTMIVPICHLTSYLFLIHLAFSFTLNLIKSILTMFWWSSLFFFVDPILSYHVLSSSSSFSSSSLSSSCSSSHFFVISIILIFFCFIILYFIIFFFFVFFSLLLSSFFGAPS